MKIFSMIVGGDAMLGRLVKEAILTHGSDYPLHKIAPLLRSGDITLINLECAITDYAHVWSGPAKVFYFGAPPITSQILQTCGVDVVSLANNHILDFDYQGCYDTLYYLNQVNIYHAGAGVNLSEAENPVIFTSDQYKIGMSAFCDHQEDFAASQTTPGTNYLPIFDQELALQKIATPLKKMQAEHVNLPILSLHWGPNMVHRPDIFFVEFAHRAIDMGYKMIFGHSAHVFHGMEIYKHCPIIYAAGDLVDDYYVDPEFKNDHQLIFKLEWEEHRLKAIYLYPIFIQNCQTQFANKEQFNFIANRITLLSAEFGTRVKPYNSKSLVISSD